MRTLTSLLGNSQRLDGGAMFGNAPKGMWARWLAPDEQNRIPLACRALLLRDGTRNVLFETGIGAFFEPAMKERFGVVEPEHVLLASLAAAGLTPADIDVVVFSHLHFDHAGGALTSWQAGQAPGLVFPNAHYVIGKQAWARANAPHARDRASFIPALQELLAATGRVELVDGLPLGQTDSPTQPGAGSAVAGQSATLGQGVRFWQSEGHTPGLLLAEVDMPNGPVVFAADLIPGRPWVHVPITMGYDRYPELLIEEKATLLASLQRRGGRLFFTHDPTIALGKVVVDAKGKYGTADDLAALRELVA